MKTSIFDSAVAVAIALASVTAVACGADTSTPGASDEPTSANHADAGAAMSQGSFGQEHEDAVNTPSGESCQKMDIVFVIDNSGSMGEEQDNLAQNFPKFGAIIDGFKTKSGTPLDYRLAVTTTDMTAENGAFIRKSSSSSMPSWWPFASGSGPCDAGPDRPWLERGDAKPVDYFACRAHVGTGGSAVELPLASLQQALTTRIADGTNAAGGQAFLREDALLAFIVVTDEDESNPKPTMTEYVAAFDAIKGGERGRWAAAVIAGENDCHSATFGSATEATQLKDFVTGVGANGVFAPLCEGDLTPGVTKALNLFDLACKSFPTTPK